MSDTFKTHNSQLKILRSKGLIVPTDSKRILEVYSYNSVINGYREPFVASTKPFRFKKNTKFSEIFSLYEFDSELRNLFMRHILKIEQKLRSQISYAFSNANRTNNRAYLDFRNYDYKRSTILVNAKGPGKKVKDFNPFVHEVISTLSKKLSNQQNPHIAHYISEHQSVPIWILVNTLTLGELRNFYIHLMPDQRDNVAAFFNMKEYELDWFMLHLSVYRNKCAHDERFYNHKIYWGMIDVYHLHQRMFVFFTKKEINSFESNIKSLFRKYQNKFQTISVNLIIKEMGYPASYNII